MAASRRFCKPEASRAPMAEPNRPTARPKTVIDLAARCVFEAFECQHDVLEPRIVIAMHKEVDNERPAVQHLAENPCCSTSPSSLGGNGKLWERA